MESKPEQLTAKEVLEMIRAGYTKEEIATLFYKPVEPPKADTPPEPPKAPEKKPEEANESSEVSKTLAELKKTLADIQAANLKNATIDSPATATVSDYVNSVYKN